MINEMFFALKKKQQANLLKPQNVYGWASIKGKVGDICTKLLPHNFSQIFTYHLRQKRGPAHDQVLHQ